MKIYGHLPINQEEWDEQKWLDESCLRPMCKRCGRQDNQMEAETGLCLVCIGKEEEC